MRCMTKVTTHVEGKATHNKEVTHEKGVMRGMTKQRDRGEVSEGNVHVKRGRSANEKNKIK